MSDEEEDELEPRLVAIKAFLESLTDKENQRVRSFRPLVKDWAGDVVLVELTDPKRPFESIEDILMHLSITAAPMVEYNNLWRKKMAKKRRFRR